jgi:hypothetical protein
MARERPVAPKFDAKMLRSASDLLRHLSHPLRLQSNLFAAPYFRRYASFAPGGDEAAMNAVTAVVQCAVESLSPRLRSIVERCDLNGARHADTAIELGISAAHFYRERRRALETIASALISGANHPARQLRVLPDAYSVALVEATTLETVGRSGEAIRVLARCATNSQTASRRVNSLVRLVEACAMSGRSHDAVQYADKARIVAQCSDASESDRLEGEAAWALALHCSGDELAASACAASLVIPLRALLAGSSVTTLEAFTNVAILLVESGIERGATSRALSLCEEAIGRLRENGMARLSLTVRASRTRAFAGSFCCDPVTRTVNELERTIEYAIANGLVLEAAATATSLSSLFRLFGRPITALETLQPLAEVFRTVFNGADRGSALTEMAAAQTEAGRPDSSLSLIAEVRRDRSIGTYIHARSYLVEAAAALRLGRHRRALDAAETAAGSMRRLGRLRGVGSALRFKALALEMTGDMTSAGTVIAEASDLLSAFGTKQSAVRAEVDAARIAGDRPRALRLRQRLTELNRAIDRCVPGV